MQLNPRSMSVNRAPFASITSFNTVQNIHNAAAKTDSLNFSEIHERIKGKIHQKWPEDIRNSLEKIEKVAETLFPFNGDKTYVFLLPSSFTLWAR